MDYIECAFTLDSFRPWNEIIIAQLNEVGFESFVEEEKSSLVKAYIQKSDFNKDKVTELLSVFGSELKYDFKVSAIEKENWNQKWEENFDSVEVGSFCYIRAPFHDPKPSFTHEIIIEPKMSFGTGHHQTTQMMIELMESIEFDTKTVLDMGSGTGILAILAKRMGAASVDAIDIEDWAFENMKENVERNKVEVDAYLGGVERIKEIGKEYDVIIANINKNILLSQFDIYNKQLKVGGLLLLSGFYQSDADDLMASESINNYQLEKQLSKQGWCGLKLKK